MRQILEVGPLLSSLSPLASRVFHVGLRSQAELRLLLRIVLLRSHAALQVWIRWRSSTKENDARHTQCPLSLPLATHEFRF